MVAGLSTGAMVVFALVVIALVLFVTEAIPNDVTAIGIIVALAFLEPVVGLTPAEAIGGFANPATITIVAMYMLSAGIQQSGLVQRLGSELERVTRGNETRLLTATVATTTPIAGFINNTPVVAVFIPMITDLARRSRVSPSKLLIPLSYAAILGGTLTLVGTATNIIASDLAAELLDRGPIGFFEFTPVGVLVAAVGVAYLLTIGSRLTPARLEPEADLATEFAIQDHLYLLGVRDTSAVAGQRLTDIEGPAGVTVIALQRGPATYGSVDADHRLESGDVMVVLGRFGEVDTYARTAGLARLYGREVDEGAFESAARPGRLAKLLVPERSSYIGQTVEECRLETRYDTTVLAIVRGTDRIVEEIAETAIEAGDTLLVRSVPEALAYLHERGDVIRVDAPPDELLQGEATSPPDLTRSMAVALAVLGGVVLLAALDIVPIVIAALLGVFTLIATDQLRPSEAYGAVSWSVIFLIAGVLPLGVAIERTGGATWIADGLVSLGGGLPLIVVLLAFVVLTGLLANVITPVATVVLMIPIAVDAAAQLGANEFSFLLGVMFASATSFMTPIGYQTNLMVYGPGGYRFADFIRVGAPLQLLSAVVITIGIAGWWGLTP